MLALAGAARRAAPLPRSRRGRLRGDVGELLVGAYDDPGRLDRLADGADAVTYEFENVLVSAARSVWAVPDPRALELGQGPPRREGSLPQSRDRDRSVRIA